MDSLTIVVLITFFLLGAILGSFVVASVWRLRANDLASRKKSDLTKQESSEYELLVTNSKLGDDKFSKDRSRCLSCQHQLAWYDLLPIVSWLSLRGKCRYCGEKIGWLEFLAEIIMGALFAVTFYYLQSESWYVVVIWLVLLVVLAILFIYDLKWKLLPSKVLYMGVAIAVVFAIINVIKLLPDSSWQSILSDYLITWACLGGIYLFLTIVSKGTWVGDGDWLVGTIVSMVLANPWLGVAALFVTNLLGCLIVLIMVFRHGKLNETQKSIPLGPLLIVALLLVYVFKNEILNFMIF